MRISVDDACASDVRLADLCQKYEIPCTFYWPVEWRSYAYHKDFEPLSLIDATKIAQNFEVGSHTVTHRLLTDLNVYEAQLEIADSKFMLEALFNKPVKKFCPPRGYTNSQLTAYTLQFYDSERLTRGKNLVHIHPDSGANGNIPWRKAINKDTTEVWCHSWELDKFRLWKELEDYLAHR